MSLGVRWNSPDVFLGYHLSDINDFGSGAYTLTNVSGVTFPVDGFGNACANFTGTANNLSRTTSSPTTNNDFTISFWVKFATVNTSTIYGILRWANAASGYFYTRVTLTRDTGATYTLSVYPSGVTAISYNIPNFTLNKWYYVAITHTAAGAIALYLNGGLVATGTSGTSSGLTNIYLGTDNTNTELLGRLDEVVFYKSVKSAPDVRRLYADGKGMLV